MSELYSAVRILHLKQRRVKISSKLAGAHWAEVSMPCSSRQILSLVCFAIRTDFSRLYSRYILDTILLYRQPHHRSFTYSTSELTRMNSNPFRNQLEIFVSWIHRFCWTITVRTSFLRCFELWCFSSLASLNWFHHSIYWYDLHPLHIERDPCPTISIMGTGRLNLIRGHERHICDRLPSNHGDTDV